MSDNNKQGVGHPKGASENQEAKPEKKKAGRPEGSVSEPRVTVPEFYAKHKDMTLGQVREAIKKARLRCSWPTCKEKLDIPNLLNAILQDNTEAVYCNTCQAEIDRMLGHKK
jgi:hypothetical protein